MQVAALQWDVRRGAGVANLDAAEAALAQAIAAGCQLVVLPEVWATSFPDGRDQPELLEIAEAGAEWAAKASLEHGLVLAGTQLADAGEGRFYNRLMVWDGGAPILTYDKVHLFTPTAEHEVFAAGDAPPPIVESSLGRLSGVICYDLRFGELFSRFVGAGVEWVVCPAQWPVARALHWEGLVRGRAVESQAVVVACNRTGVETIGRSAKQLEFGGNSLIVDGHGQVLGAGRGQAGAVIASIDRQAQQQLRVRVPVRKDRRPDLYQEWLNPD